MKFRVFSSLVVGIFVAGGAAADPLVTNPGFDGSTAGWELISDPSVVAAYSAEDASGDPASGSASVTNIYPGIGTAASGYFQCVSVVGSTEYRIGSTVKIPAVDHREEVLEPAMEFVCAAPESKTAEAVRSPRRWTTIHSSRPIVSSGRGWLSVPSSDLLRGVAPIWAPV